MKGPESRPNSSALLGKGVQTHPCVPHSHPKRAFLTVQAGTAHGGCQQEQILKLLPCDSNACDTYCPTQGDQAQWTSQGRRKELCRPGAVQGISSVSRGAQKEAMGPPVGDPCSGKDWTRHHPHQVRPLPALRF